MSDPDNTPQAIGMAALDAFITTFNSRHPEAWAASLSYPHVRVAPRPGATVVSATEADYATEATYEAADAMGWDHSEWDAKTILAVSPDRIHASAQWCRYDASGRRIVANNVSYVITDVDGRWGIQARFGVDSPPPADPDATADLARAALTSLLAAVSAERLDGVERHVRLPLVSVGVGQIGHAVSASDVVAVLRAVADTPGPSAITALQVGTRGVNLGVDLPGIDGRPRRHGLFLVVVDGDDARVAATSLLAASP